MNQQLLFSGILLLVVLVCIIMTADATTTTAFQHPSSVVIRRRARRSLIFTTTTTTIFDQQNSNNEDDDNNSDDDYLDVQAFQSELQKRQAQPQPPDDDDDDDEVFDGYALRDIILEKWGECFDVDFQPVDTLGMREIYLNVLPFKLGSRKFRHETEMDYLCHCQAVVDILHKYDQVGNILWQIDQTNKKPRAGTSPLIAVPLRLDLSPEEVNQILGYKQM
jgi:hypothetical protein